MFEVVQFQDRLQRETIMPTIGEIDWRDRFESNDRIKGSKYHDDSLMGYGGNDTIDGEAGSIRSTAEKEAIRSMGGAAPTGSTADRGTMTSMAGLAPIRWPAASAMTGTLSIRSET
jgi:hypothetical protein